MRFHIHFEYADGTEDSFVLEGDTLDEIRSKAAREIERRGGRNPWSEELSKR